MKLPLHKSNLCTHLKEQVKNYKKRTDYYKRKDLSTETPLKKVTTPANQNESIVIQSSDKE